MKMIDRSDSLREFCKKIYKFQKRRDALVGIQINFLMNGIHQELKKLKEAKETFDEKNVNFLKEKIVELRKERRFRDDFPSFSKFYKFITTAKNEVTVEDLKNFLV